MVYLTDLSNSTAILNLFNDALLASQVIFACIILNSRVVIKALEILWNEVNVVCYKERTKYLPEEKQRKPHVSIAGLRI
jgi:hypothetical protein